MTSKKPTHKNIKYVTLKNGIRKKYVYDWRKYAKPYIPVAPEDRKKLGRPKKYINSTFNDKAVCECGGKYTLKNKKAHSGTKKHIKFITQST